MITMQDLSLKKKRVMIYFIDATKQVITEDGMEHVSIRRIAELAGYNSATIYNYFEDLHHLILFASMSYLQEYVILLGQKIKPSMNALERYHMVYQTFDYVAFRSPELFYNMFFGPQRDKLSSVIADYYALFPEELASQSQTIRQMLLQGDMYQRDRPMILELVQEGFLSKERADITLELLPRIHQTYLHEMVLRKSELDPDEQHHKFSIAIDYMINEHL